MRVYVSFDVPSRRKGAHAIVRVESALTELGISSTSSSIVDAPEDDEEMGPAITEPIPGQEELLP